MELKEEIHPDGLWNTSRISYRETEIVLKSRESHGMKAHCIVNGKVIFTRRYKFIKPQSLIDTMKSRIDMWKSGTWTPKSLK